MTAETDLARSLFGAKSLPPMTLEEAWNLELGIRRRFAGTQLDRPSGGDRTRSTDGEWMQRITLDLPDAMRLALEDRAESRGVTVDQVIRETLAAAGIGDPSHAVGIQDGTARDDEEHKPSGFKGLVR